MRNKEPTYINVDSNEKKGYKYYRHSVIWIKGDTLF